MPRHARRIVPYRIVKTPLNKPKPNDEIPVPEIKYVDAYERDILPDYGCPTSYVRYNRLSHEELRESLEYVIDTEDETWLKNNTKFGAASVVSLDDIKYSKEQSSAGIDENTAGAIPSEDSAYTKRKAAKHLLKTTLLPISMLEIMFDILEKATAFEAIITLDQAEHLIVKKLPQFYHMYPVRAKAGIVTIRHVMTDVYYYWVSKRSKLKRPLIRRFWPVTSTDDTNPHLVFRPREKEKYKLRKKRQNDMDAYIKLQQLKQDFSQIRLLMGLIQKREELNRSLILLQKEWFEQKLYDAIDTSGLCRVSQDLDRKSLDELLEVEKYFDINEVKRKKSRGRPSLQHQDGDASSREGSRSTTPVPPSSSLSAVSLMGFGNNSTGITMNLDRNYPGVASGGPVGDPGSPKKAPMVIAGQNNGEPAPSFLQPLITRESYATTWEGSVPHVTTIIDGQPVPTYRFRHRPRVGRGGRLCIDRVPLPTDPNVAPNTYFRAGSRSSMSHEPKERLLDLLPLPIDKDKLSRRIEEICISALKEDYDAHAHPNGPPSTTTAAVTTATASLEDTDDNDGTREVVVKMKDWLNTDEQLWGEERYAIGPI
ncbi:MAG: enhancer of polycomb-like protein [Bacillariaceae sp.]|jgi:enhancer of polycomb-like protein